MKNKALTTFMATAVTAAIVLPVPTANAALSDLSVNYSQNKAIQTAEQVITSKSTIPSGETSLTITSITTDTVRTSMGNLGINKSLKPILKSTNRQALQNAKATVVVKNGEIKEITALTLNKGGTNKKPLLLDGGSAMIAGNLTVAADYIKIENVKIENELIVSNRASKAITIDSVAIGDSITINPLIANKTNWLNVTLKDVQTPEINVHRNKTTLISDQPISIIHVKNKVSTIDVKADVEDIVIDVDNDFSLLGEGKIDQVLVQRGDNVLLNSSHKIEKVQVKDKSAKVTFAQVDKTKLQSLISSIKYVPVSVYGNEILTTDKWTTQSERNVFDSAVSNAQSVVKNTKASQTQINDAYKNLNTALAKYQAAQKYGKKHSSGDRSTLSSIINSVQYVTVSSSNGYDVPTYMPWTTQAEKNTLETAVSSAQSVLNNVYATYDQVSSAIYNLTNAITTYKNVQKYGTYGYAVDKTMLTWLINSIQYVEVSSNNGYDISPSTLWTTHAEKNNLVSAVSSAQTVLVNAYASQDQVSSAINTLNNAFTTYKNAQKYGNYGYAVDKTTLSSLLANVKYVTVSVNGNDVSPSVKWTTPEVYNNFLSAVTSAQTIRDNPNVTQDQVNSALINLSSALSTYISNQDYGKGTY